MAGGSPVGFLTPHELYTRLGATPEERSENYRALVALGVTEDELALIRTSVAKRRALGSAAFC